jgi:spore germination cell wall hydrolase CwlJ-like protein
MDSPFIWGDGGAQLTPEQIAARRKAADALIASGTDATPIRSGWQGVARVAQALSGAMDSRSADSAELANVETNKKLIADALAAYQGGGSPAAAAPTPVVPATAPVAAAPAAVDTSGKIYRNDEPSPLDPPSGADRDALIRTVYGEAGNEPALGQQAVASVIRNRAVDGSYGGDTPSAVVKAPFQFEPWNGGPAKDRMLALSPDDPKYAAIAKVVDAAYGTGGRAPEDPTEGKTLFYAPAAQAALGRPAPAWAKGAATVIGSHKFYDDTDGTAAKPGQVASDDPAAIPVAAAATEGTLPAAPAAEPVAKVAGAMSGVNPAVLAAMTSPYASDSTKKIAGIILAQQLTPKDVHTQETDAKGNVWDVNKLTGQRTVALKSDTETPKFTSYKGPDGVEIPGFTSNGTFTPINPKTAGTASATSGLTGQAFLDAIEPGRANVIKQISQGQMAPPTAAALRSDKVMKLIDEVSQYDPGFDATKWKRRFDTASDFSSKGKSGQSVQSLNTVYGHIGDLAEKANLLDNVDGIPIVNTYVNEAKNAYASGSGGDKVNNFNLARNAVSDELSKVFKGAGISDHEIEQWKGTLNSSQSPTQLRGAIKTALGLVESRIAALNNSRDAGMDTNTDPHELLNPHSKETLARIQKWVDGGKLEAAPAAAPTAAATPAAAVNIQTATNPQTGEKLMLKDGQWVPMK